MPDEESFASLFTYLEEALTPEGLYAYWPGSRGYVNLTSYTVEFLQQAEAAGIAFENELLEKPRQALVEALRSDYGRFVPGYDLRERIGALIALERIGYFDPGYAQDLIAGAFQSDLYSKSRILQLFYRRDLIEQQGVQNLLAALWESLVFRLREGEEVFDGFDYRTDRRGGLVLASEIKTLSAALRALHEAAPEDRRIPLLVEELIRRGGADGWGSTHSNIQALFALQDLFAGFEAPISDQVFSLRIGDEEKELAFNGKNTISLDLTDEGAVFLTAPQTDEDSTPFVWYITEYVPDIPGDQLKSENRGFVVEREHHRYGTSGDFLVSRDQVASGVEMVYGLDEIVEEHVRVTNAEERTFVAVKVPIASGFEPMNPRLATAPREAFPVGRNTLEPSYVDYADDSVTYFYETMPSGTFDFYFRIRASFEGSFVQPPARSEMMYDFSVVGRSDGARVIIEGN